MERLSSARLAAMASAVAVLSGCASLPPQRGSAAVNELMVARGAPAVEWQKSAAADRSAAVDEQEISREAAIRMAFAHNAKVLELYASLGIASADVLEASRLANPRIGYVSLAPEGGGLSQITRSISLDFTSALLLPARGRLARSELARTRDQVADALLELALRVESSWYEAVSAAQVAELREIAATAGDASGEMAQRLFDAGNISPKALALEKATTAEQRVAAARAKADAVRARTALAEVMGVSTRLGWRIPARLPALVEQATKLDEQGLVRQAAELRLDLSAARREVATSEDFARVTHRWRWVGEIEGGYERESETDGSKLRGPSIAIGLPLFNQGQGSVLRADSQAEAARARLAETELRVRNDVARSLDQIAAAREVADAYRTALLPQHETVVQSTQEEHNFMLVGVFELLQARRAQLDASQAYLEAVRDYWIARSELKRAVGGKLPDESEDAP